MKEIKITSSNKTMIQAIFDKFQRNTWERELNYEELENATFIAESLIDNILFMKDRQNIKAFVRPLYSAFKPEYPDGAMQTICYIRRGVKCWYLTKIERVAVQRAGSIRVEIDAESIIPKIGMIYQFLSQNLKSNEVLK